MSIIEINTQTGERTEREKNPDEIASIPVKTQAEIISEYEYALDIHLDSIAKAHRFNDRHSLALRAGYVSPYQALGIAYAQWMDGCNFSAYQRLQRVIDGVETMPTIEEFIASLPEFVAP